MMAVIGVLSSCENAPRKSSRRWTSSWSSSTCSATVWAMMSKLSPSAPISSAPVTCVRTPYAPPAIWRLISDTVSSRRVRAWLSSHTAAALAASSPASI